MPLFGTQEKMCLSIESTYTNACHNALIKYKSCVIVKLHLVFTLIFTLIASWFTQCTVYKEQRSRKDTSENKKKDKEASPSKAASMEKVAEDDAEVEDEAAEDNMEDVETAAWFPACVTD